MSSLTEIEQDDDILEEEAEESTGLTSYNVKALPNDFNLKTLVDFVEEGVFTIPPFQRNFVWTKKQSSSLIESLIMGLPVPQLFLFEDGDTQLLIDGQQRLSSIYFFYRGRFPKRDKYLEIRMRSKEAQSAFIDKKLLQDDELFEDFHLQLESSPSSESPHELLGKSYETLSDKHKRTLNLQTLRTIFITQAAPNEDEGASSMYEIFHRLNTGGTNLKPQEVRQCIFYSDFYDFLNDLNKEKEWRNLYVGTPDKHLRDAEILLRCFALAEDYADYRTPMMHFLNNFSLKAKGFAKTKLDEFRELFQSFLKSFQDELADYSFRTRGKKGQFIATLFDAVFVAWAIEYKEKNNKLEITRAKVDKIRIELKSYLTKNRSTAEKSAVTFRVEKAREILREA